MSLASLLNDPKHWQDRAAQAESLADQISDVVGKATALSIAEDYARLGRRAEKRPLVRLDGAETGDRASNPAAAAVDHADHLPGGGRPESRNRAARTAWSADCETARLVPAYSVPRRWGMGSRIPDRVARSAIA